MQRVQPPSDPCPPGHTDTFSPEIFWLFTEGFDFILKSCLSQETSISVGLGLNCPFYHQVCQLLISLDVKILGNFQSQCYVSWSLHPSQAAAVGRHQDKVLTTTFGKSGYATLARVLLHPSRLWTERVWSTQQHHQAISKKEIQLKQIFHETYGT